MEQDAAEPVSPVARWLAAAGACRPGWPRARRGLSIRPHASPARPRPPSRMRSAPAAGPAWASSRVRSAKGWARPSRSILAASFSRRRPSPIRRFSPAPRSVCRYSETARGLVHRLKYGDRAELALALARMMALAGRELIGECDVIAPVPLHWTRAWSRRFNHRRCWRGDRQDIRQTCLAGRRDPRAPHGCPGRPLARAAPRESARCLPPRPRRAARDRGPARAARR